MVSITNHLKIGTSQSFTNSKGDIMLKIGELLITPINKEPFTVFGTYQVVNGIYYVRGVSYPKEIVEEVEVING